MSVDDTAMKDATFRCHIKTISPSPPDLQTDTRTGTAGASKWRSTRHCPEDCIPYFRSDHRTERDSAGDRSQMGVSRGEEDANEMYMFCVPSTHRTRPKQRQRAHRSPSRIYSRSGSVIALATWIRNTLEPKCNGARAQRRRGDDARSVRVEADKLSR